MRDPDQYIDDVESTATQKSTPASVAFAAYNPNMAVALVIEDHADVARYIASCLEDSCRIIFARNGKDGLVKAIEHVPDIILCDVMMPGMDGFFSGQCPKIE